MRLRQSLAKNQKSSLRRATLFCQCSIFSGGIGSPVAIDASSNLLNWVPLVTHVFPSGGHPFTEPGATHSPHRYYRGRLLPSSSGP
jgi:hypothetical protein